MILMPKFSTITNAYHEERQRVPILVGSNEIPSSVVVQ